MSDRFPDYESDSQLDHIVCTGTPDVQFVVNAFREGANSVMQFVHNEQLEPRRVPVNPAVLIVGGGIAGIQAALTLANADKKVYLIERDPTIGGYMAKLDKTFPTLDCSACILTPKMSSVKSHPNITLYSYSDVVGFEGYVGNFRVKIRHKPRYVDEKLCIGCYECISHCTYKEPKFPDEFNVGLGKRKPIYIPFPQATPLVACIDPNTCIQLKTGKCKMTCVSACPKDCIDFEQKERIEELKVGSIILTTGFEPFDPKGTPQYGYGKYPNVFTSVEVERLVNASGPTGGEVRLRDGSTPKSVAIIHCVGSRDTKTNKWCSRVCCMYSLKLAHLIRERTGAEIYNFYIDMRTPGKMYDEFYDRLLKEGVHFVRGRPAEITDWAMSPAEEGKLVVLAEDTLIGVARRVPVDMVVLSVGLQPHSDAKDLRKLFNITCSDGGWFAERNVKTEPVSTFIDGIFMAGACQGPKDIPDSVAQAGAAAAAVIALIDKGYVELGSNTAFVEDEMCDACGTCINLCPCRAISMNLDRNVAEVNEALCKSCGLCVPACPNGAIQQHLFLNENPKKAGGVFEHARNYR